MCCYLLTFLLNIAVPEPNVFPVSENAFVMDKLHVLHALKGNSGQCLDLILWTLSGVHMKHGVSAMYLGQATQCYYPAASQSYVILAAGLLAMFFRNLSHLYCISVVLFVLLSVFDLTVLAHCHCSHHMFIIVTMTQLNCDRFPTLITCLLLVS